MHKRRFGRKMWGGSSGCALAHGRRVREGLYTCCTECNWPTTWVATGLPPELQFVYDWSCNRMADWVGIGIQTDLQPAVQGSCNWPTQPECNWPTTKVAIYVRRKLQSVEWMSCNWYINGAATSRPVQSQLAYPTIMQLANRRVLTNQHACTWDNQ